MTGLRLLPRHSRRRLLALLLLTPAFLTAYAVGGMAGGPPVYSSLPITARVVDEDTGQPLEGVVVVVRWQLREAAPIQTRETGQLMVAEAVTDATGNFHVPAWGPKPVTPLVYVPEEAPQLLFLKQGYHPTREVNIVTGAESAGPIIQSKWNGQTIKLTKFTGSEKEWADLLGRFEISLNFAFSYHDCSWKQIPRMIVAMHLEEKRLREKRIFSHLRSIEDREEEAKLGNCGSAQEFLRSYLP